MKVLISVFMGLACGLALQSLLEMKDQFYLAVMYFLIFSSTIARFFEGNIIFYCEAHREQSEGQSKIDLYSTLFQFLIFAGLGFFIGDATTFTVIFLFLNLVDFVWHGSAFLFRRKGTTTSITSKFWSLSNLTFFILLSALYFYFVNEKLSELQFITIFAGTAVIAAFADYYCMRSFYFSDKAKKVFEDF